MSAAVILDIVVLIALGVTIGYAFRLSRQLANLKADRTHIEKLIEGLSTAVTRAEAAIQNMRETALESGDALQKQINVARELFDELQLMTEAGHSLADRLQVLAERGRKSVTASPDTKTDSENDASKSRAEKELIEALEARKRGQG